MSLKATQALSSFPSLKAYFKIRGDKAIVQIKKKPHPEMPRPLRVHANLSGRWYVCQIVTAPLRIIFAAYIYIAGELITIFHQKTGKNICWFAERVMVGFTDYSTEKTKVYWLQKQVNWPQKGEASRFNKGTLPIPIESIKDPKVRDLLDFPLRKMVSFHRYNGICSGISVWFLTLYLRTRPFFKKNSLAHIEVLSHLFKNGGPKETVFIHSFFLNHFWWDTKGQLLNRLEGAFLGIKVQKKSTDILLEQSGVFQENTYQNKEIAKRTINKMPNGAYILNFPSHQTAFIKINKKLGFFINPNEGVYVIKGPDLAEKLLDLSLSSLNLRTGNFNPVIDKMNFFRIKILK